jgi:hypothetical protein
VQEKLRYDRLWLRSPPIIAHLLRFCSRFEGKLVVNVIVMYSPRELRLDRFHTALIADFFQFFAVMIKMILWLSESIVIEDIVRLLPLPSFESDIWY